MSFALGPLFSVLSRALCYSCHSAKLPMKHQSAAAEHLLFRQDGLLCSPNPARPFIRGGENAKTTAAYRVSLWPDRFVAGSPFVGPWVKFYLLWKADTRTPSKIKHNRLQTWVDWAECPHPPPGVPKVPSPPALHHQHVNMVLLVSDGDFFLFYFFLQFPPKAVSKQQINRWALPHWPQGRPRMLAPPGSKLPHPTPTRGN